MQRTVYYVRVSTEEEHQAALVTKCMENEEFINDRNDWVLVGKYIDEGKSGMTTEGRSEFNRMLDDMENDKFDIILMKQIDRGRRSLGDWQKNTYNIQQRKIWKYVSDARQGGRSDRSGCRAIR